MITRTGYKSSRGISKHWAISTSNYDKIINLKNKKLKSKRRSIMIGSISIIINRRKPRKI